MDSRTDESCNHQRNLGLNLHGPINTKEQSVLQLIKDAFEGEDMQAQYSIYKSVVKVDKLGHNDGNIDHEIQRPKAIEKELGCELIRINPNEQSFNTDTLKNQLINL